MKCLEQTVCYQLRGLFILSVASLFYSFSSRFYDSRLHHYTQMRMYIHCLVLNSLQCPVAFNLDRTVVPRMSKKKRETSLSLRGCWVSPERRSQSRSEHWGLCVSAEVLPDAVELEITCKIWNNPNRLVITANHVELRRLADDCQADRVKPPQAAGTTSTCFW